MCELCGPSRNERALIPLFLVNAIPMRQILRGKSKQIHPFSSRGAAALRAAGLPGRVCQVLLPLRGRGWAGRSGNLYLIPPASHLHRFQSGDMVNRRSNHWLNTIPTLFDLGQGVHFWAGKILGLRKSLKNVASPSNY